MAHVCVLCRATKEIDRMPQGWKALAGNEYCGSCWRDRYAVRAVTIPIVSPVGIGWPELRKRLRESFDMTTQATNYVIRQMAAHDVGIDPATGKLPKLVEPRPNGKSLYKNVADHWAIATQTAVCLVQSAVQKYKGTKIKPTRWHAALGKVSVPTARYPQPIPVLNATWSVSEGDDGGLVLDFPLGRKQRVKVRLKGGQNYRRALADVRRIIKGEAIQGQLDIIEKGSYPNTKQFAKLVAWFPKTTKRDGWTAALVASAESRTTPEQPATPCFLALYNDADAGSAKTLYRWNADHQRRRIAAQDEQMQRLREDLKAEKRLGRERDGILARMDLLSRNHAHYMHDFCHTVSRQVIQHLERRRCGMLIYNDSSTSYMPHFPWHKLKTMLADKANRAGIEFASGGAASDSPEPLEGITQ